GLIGSAGAVVGPGQRRLELPEEVIEGRDEPFPGNRTEVGTHGARLPREVVEDRLIRGQHREVGPAADEAKFVRIDGLDALTRGRSGARAQGRNGFQGPQLWTDEWKLARRKRRPGVEVVTGFRESLGGGIERDSGGLPISPARRVHTRPR